MSELPHQRDPTENLQTTNFLGVTDKDLHKFSQDNSQMRKTDSLETMLSLYRLGCPGVQSTANLKTEIGWGYILLPVSGTAGSRPTNETPEN